MGWVSGMGSRSDWSGWWHGGEFGQVPEVLDSGGQQELVPCTGEPSEPEPSQAEVPFQIAETGPDFLALASGLEKCFRPHQGSGTAARCLQLPAKPTQIDYTVDPARQMIARHHVIKTKLIEQTLLPTHLLTHYDPDPLAEWPLGDEGSIVSSTHASY